MLSIKLPPPSPAEMKGTECVGTEYIAGLFVGFLGLCFKDVYLERMCVNVSVYGCRRYVDVISPPRILVYLFRKNVCRCVRVYVHA